MNFKSEADINFEFLEDQLWSLTQQTPVIKLKTINLSKKK